MILLYHKIYPTSPTEWWVTVGNFYRQMIELQWKKIVYLDQYCPDNPDHLVITFDGCYENVVTYAAPILKHFGYPFEVFIVGDLIGKDNTFESDKEPYAKFANLEQLQLLIKYGGHLQWHTKTHKKLIRLSLKEMMEEIEIPTILRDMDQSGFKWLAYPYGEYNEILIAEAKKRFKGAVSVIQGNDKDIYKLNRLIVTNKTSFKKASTGVIITSYNYGHFLPEAIESVLRQTRLPDRILISDDCSKDDTYEIAIGYKNMYPDLIEVNRNEKNLGIANHFNRALSLMDTDYIMFLGADNRLRSDYLEKTSIILDKNSEVGIVYTDFAFFGPKAKIQYCRFGNEFKGPVIEDTFFIIKFPDFNEKTKKIILKDNFIHGSALFRSRIFKEVGGFDENSLLPEDHNLWIKIIKAGYRAQRVPLPLLEYRQFSNKQANIRNYTYRQMLFYRNECKRLREILEEKSVLFRIYKEYKWFWEKIKNKLKK